MGAVVPMTGKLQTSAVTDALWLRRPRDPGMLIQ
jgi:hypothetical protein